MLISRLFVLSVRFFFSSPFVSFFSGFCLLIPPASFLQRLSSSTTLHSLPSLPSIPTHCSPLLSPSSITSYYSPLLALFILQSSFV